MYERSENFNKEVENIRKYQLKVTELKNIITKLKNTLWASTADLLKQKKKSQLEDKAVEITQLEQQKEKKEFKKVKIV